MLSDGPRSSSVFSLWRLVQKRCGELSPSRGQEYETEKKTWSLRFLLFSALVTCTFWSHAGHVDNTTQLLLVCQLLIHDFNIQLHHMPKVQCCNVQESSFRCFELCDMACYGCDWEGGRCNNEDARSRGSNGDPQWTAHCEKWGISEHQWVADIQSC